MSLKLRASIWALFAAVLVSSCGKPVPGPEQPPQGDPVPAPVEATNPPTNEITGEDAKAMVEKLADPEAIPDPKPVAPAGTGGWKASKMSVKEFAARFSSNMAKLQGVEGKADLRVKTPEGEGRMELTYEIASPTKYRIEFVEPTLVPKRALIVSDGVRKVEFKDKKFGKVVPEPTQVAVDSAPSAWIRNFSRLLFARISDKRDSAGELAKLLAADNAIATAIEERTLERNGKKVFNLRIRGERKPPSASKQGPLKFEIVVDGVRWMPVTVRTETGTGKNLWRYEWSCGWNFGRTFPESKFAVKAPGQ